jgi:hypothetical protein
MADNFKYNEPASGISMASKDVGGLHFQKCIFTNDAGVAMPGDATNGLDVDVTRLPADPFGANADAIVAAGAAGSVSAKLRRATQGIEDLKTGIVLATGGNVIGGVTQSGTWNVGTVTTVTTVAAVTAITNALPSGTNAIGKLAANGGVIIGDVNAIQSGAWNVADGGGSLTVDGSVSVSGLVPGTTATSLGKAEDAPAADGDTGVMMLAVRKDTAATTVGADGDYHPLEVNGNGRLWCSTLIDTALPAGNNNIGDVDVLTLPALVAGTAIIGKVGIDQTTPGTTNKVSIGSDGTITLLAGTAIAGKFGIDQTTPGTTNNVAITPPTLTKGTQGATGLSVQALNDAGRTHVNYCAVAAAAGATGVETAITLTKSSGTAATSTGTSFVITNGKRFRITAISVATRGHATATIQTTTFNLRINTGGAVATNSTPILLSVRSATPATASAWDRVIVPIPDGFEIAGDGTLQFGVTAAATFTTNAPTWDVCIIGYEY